MRNTLLTYIDRFRRDRHERLVLGFVLLFLAVIVSLTVYWQLRYIGITMTNETYCGYEEHTHDETCYDEEGDLICELPEHTHTVECLINLNADVEDATVWKATLPELTGDLRMDVVSIAYSQLGYTESTANYSIAEDGETHYGYTRYGAWYGNEYGTWDAMFASFCLNYAGLDRTVFPLNSGAYAWVVELTEKGAYAESSDYTPLAGDLVFFDSDYDGRVDRTGIVVSTDVTGGVLTIIEGDYTVSGVDTVCEHIYALKDPTIAGYGIIADSEETASEEVEEETEETVSEETEEIEDTEDTESTDTEDTEETDEEEVEVAEDITYTASDSGVTVTVIAPEGALPDGSILSVTLVDEESEEYAVAAEAVGYEEDSGIATVSEDDADSESTEETSTALAVLDISFTVDGETVEPTEPVTVIIDASSLMTADADTSTLEVQHLEETADGITPVLVADATEDTDGTIDTETAVAEFSVESFSTFTLQWTMSQGPNSKTVSITATTYLSGTEETIGNGNTTLTGTLNTAYDLTSSNTSLAIDGYTLVSATVTFNGTVYDATAITINITDNRGTTTYSYYYTNSNGNRVQLYSGNREQTVSIQLYYEKDAASITIEKYETDTATQLSGAVFTLTSDAVINGVISSDDVTLTFTDSYTATFTTNGSSITIDDLPDGNYTLTETSAPSGYDVASGTFTFTVSSNSITSTTSGSGYSYESGTVKVEDDPKTVELTVNKVYTDAAGNELSDVTDTATFTLTPTGSTTGSAETFTIKGTDSYTLECHVNGTYTLTETDVPDGYATPDEVEITIGDSDTSVTITNKQTVSVTVEKVYVDANGDVTTSGIGDLEAEFTVNGETYTVTGADTFEVTGLTDGDYTVTESSVPTGYTSSDVSFTISNGVIYDESGNEVDSITVTNAPDTANYPLMGMSYAIANLNSDQDYAIIASNLSSGGLDSDQVTLDEIDSTTGIASVYSTDGSDITIWTFEAAEEAGSYYIYTTINGVKYYLRITNGSTSASGVYISTESQAIYVTEGTGTYAGQYRFSTTSATSGNTAVNWYGGSNASNLIFGAYNDGLNKNNEMFYLCEVLEEDGLTIIDNLISDGEYEAHLVIDGKEVDLTDSKYTVTWYKAGYAFDSSYNCYVNGSYSEVTNSDALGDNNSTVNVAIDQGGLCYYYVTVSYYDAEKDETVTLESDVVHVPYAAELLNCSFEWNSSGTQDQSYIPFWNTTASTGNIEIGSYSSSSTSYGTNTSESGGAETGIYAGGSQAAAGSQFAELNADTESTLYQSVLTVGGEELTWTFYHRARTNSGGGSFYNATDTMYIVLMSEEDAQKLFAYADASGTAQQTILTNMINNMTVTGGQNDTNATDYKEGTYTFTLNNESVTINLSVWTLTTYNEIYGDWTNYYGTYEVPDEQYVTRFFFVSGETQYTASKTVGNLIDYATFSQGVTYTIEYWTRDQNSGEYTLVKTETGSEYPYTNIYADISTYTAAGYGLVGSVTGISSGGNYPAEYDSGGTYDTSTYTSMFDQYTTTGMRVTSDTMYLSVYLSMPVVTVVKEVEGLTETQLDEMLDESDYDVTFTITDNDTGDITTLTVHVGSTGVGSNYTAELVVDHTYTISEEVVYNGSYLADYDMSVTVSGANTTNALGSYTFTVEKEKSITITFTNTYAEVETGGPEMPQTGGRGTKMYTMVGILLISGASYLLYRLKLQKQLKQQKRKCRWRWNI